MFGYIRVDKANLKCLEFDQYRGVYCTLCRALGRRYGIFSRMTLSYDLTFLAIFSLALSSDCPGFANGRCSFNPMKKCLRCGGKNGVAAIDRAADISVLISFYKLEDVILDERFLKRFMARAAKLVLSRSFKKACSRRPEEAEAIREYMQTQRKLEAEKISSVDAAADPSARLIAGLAREGLSGEMGETVWRFGYFLGRFIYLADAADDYEKDIASGKYNPFALQSQEMLQALDAGNMKKYAAQTLRESAAVCLECYEQIPIRHFDGILRNALIRGMPAVIRQVTEPDEKRV